MSEFPERFRALAAQVADLFAGEAIADEIRKTAQELDERLTAYAVLTRELVDCLEAHKLAVRLRPPESPPIYQPQHEQRRAG